MTSSYMDPESSSSTYALESVSLVNSLTMDLVTWGSGFFAYFFCLLLLAGYSLGFSGLSSTIGVDSSFLLNLGNS